ncbi:MAG: GDSL-type esterase/lipase family protein [Thermoguttaceae bacterium]
MIRSVVSSWLLFSAFAVSLFAQHVAVTPTDKQDDWWVKRHAGNVSQIQKEAGNIELLMIGDSITNGWNGNIWNQYFAHRKPINMGFSADRTEHVLWRLDNLPLDKISPKVAVLMIGTNNIGHDSSNPRETADGIKAIIEKLEKTYPNMKILVLNVFPRDEKPDGPKRKQVDEINSYLPDVVKGKNNVTLLNINDVFLDESGVLSKEIMPDSLHPKEFGYRLWAIAMEPTLTKLLGETNPATTPANRLGEDWWKQRHEGNVAQMEKGDVELLMIGDSITHGWDGQNELYQKYFGDYKPINLGFSGDQTQHVLWRLENLPLNKISPKVAMIMIGTNNIGNRANTPWMIADGIRKIIEKLQSQYPEIQVIVQSVFPRGEKADDGGRIRVSEINLALAPLIAGMKNVELIDFGSKFLSEDGTMPKEIMGDFLHPTAKGYEIWGEQVLPVLKAKFGR